MTGVHIIALISALITLSLIVELSRRRHLHEKYAVMWLAVAVVIGTAFNAIVASLVGDVITPLIGAIVGQPNFNNFALYVHNNPIGVGKFLTAVVHFLIVASVVYFGVVLPLNHMLAQLKKPAPPVPPSTKACPECLSDIPLAAKRCAHCAQLVA